MSDTISRQAAIDALESIGSIDTEADKEYARSVFEALPSAQSGSAEKDIRAMCGECDAWNIYKNYLSAQPEQRWIPCSERLPEEDVEVLITYRYKEGEGDTSHADIDITTYGQMYFGGNKVGNHKHWRQPFEYFESNYEVVAWMPLPEPYKDGEQDG